MICFCMFRLIFAAEKLRAFSRAREIAWVWGSAYLGTLDQKTSYLDTGLAPFPALQSKVVLIDG